ncbi:MAG TPA: hypothetical protein VIE65_13040 [Methylobacter sp.]|jgi:hypothetical protein
MSIITGKNWGWGFRYNAYREVSSTGEGVDDAAIGAIDAPGCIPCGSTVADPILSGVAASTATIRASGKVTEVPETDLL